MDLLQRYSSIFRACAFCGCSWGKTDWLCQNCEKEFLKRLSLKTRLLGHLQHHYLIDWIPGDQFVNQLVYSLKGEGLFQSYLNMTLIFSSFKAVTAPDCIYYPSKGLKDHGYQWGRAFSEVFSCSMEELKLIGSSKQALLRRGERSGRRLKGSLVSAQNPYFVDDIVTSGATANAAFKALGQPGKLTIWSLFYRRTL